MKDDLDEEEYAEVKEDTLSSIRDFEGGSSPFSLFAAPHVLFVTTVSSISKGKQGGYGSCILRKAEQYAACDASSLQWSLPNTVHHQNVCRKGT